MGNKYIMQDMLVILPGITGSVLEQNGRPIWAPFKQAITSYVRTRGGSLKVLRIEQEDPAQDDLGDGVRATGLIPYTFIPGLDCFDGYIGLTWHLWEAFKLHLGEATRDGGRPANYFEFSYDWRRDNRVSARGLKYLIDRELPRWRKDTDNPSAKAILIGHSMGGLIARYYVECLEGFVNTRAIITFGTPHRGAVTALDYLARGYRLFGIELRDFTEAMRSMTSVYQLLPRYKAVLDTDGAWRRPCEIAAGKIPTLDNRRAQAAFDFYEDIEKCHDHNQGVKEYEVTLIPVIGYGHPTLQSARLTASGIDFGIELPPSVEPQLAAGDGTVPQVSAVPIALHQRPNQWWPWNQTHATIQNNPQLLGNLVQILANLQGNLGAPARGPGQIPASRGIALALEDIYSAEEPVAIRVTVNTEGDPSGIRANIEPISAMGERRMLALRPEGDVWTGEVAGLPVGAYRATIELQGVLAETVSDIFEVV